MRVLIVWPGADWSTIDVYRGVSDAMRRQGVEVIDYNLNGRIAMAARYIRAVKRTMPKEAPKPTGADTLYLACQGILERALRHDVNWVLIISGTYVHPEALALLRKAHLRVACLLTESPYADAQEIMIARLVDVVWTNERASVAKFAEFTRAYYWQHAMDPARHNGAPTAADDLAMAHDVVFVGTGFKERCDALRAVDWDGIDLGLYGSWELFGSRSHMRRYVREGIVDNALTAALYRKAKIGLNLHRTSIGFGRSVGHITHAESMGPRCYELAACGRFFITDRRAEVDEVFGGLVPTFELLEDLGKHVRYWLAHDDERERIAAMLPGCVQQHTFDNRVAEMLTILER